jgi:hypothetical protein
LQAWPHAPQFIALVERSTSHPLPLAKSQSPKPALHDETAQRPAVHVGVAFGTLQALPHAPQFIVSVAVEISQPSLAPPLQSVNPARHDAIAHRPDEHAGVAFATLHALPHAPQLAGSPAVHTSQPSTGAWLQSV